MSEPVTPAPAVDDSILLNIKKMLGLDVDYTAFNTDIIVLLNSAFMKLQQIGVGPLQGFVVRDEGQKWSDFLPSDTMLEAVKTYLYLSIKIIFDPPANSYVMDAMKSEKEELEWRLREQAEYYPGDGSRQTYFQKLAAEEEAITNNPGGDA